MKTRRGYPRRAVALPVYYPIAAMVPYTALSVLKSYPVNIQTNNAIGGKIMKLKIIPNTGIPKNICSPNITSIPIPI